MLSYLYALYDGEHADRSAADECMHVYQFHPHCLKKDPGSLVIKKRRQTRPGSSGIRSEQRKRKACRPASLFNNRVLVL